MFVILWKEANVPGELPLCMCEEIVQTPQKKGLSWAFNSTVDLGVYKIMCQLRTKKEAYVFGRLSVYYNNASPQQLTALNACLFAL